MGYYTHFTPLEKTKGWSKRENESGVHNIIQLNECAFKIYELMAPLQSETVIAVIKIWSNASDILKAQKCNQLKLLRFDHQPKDH